jgi:hypothetical protein
MASAYEKRPGKFYARWRDRNGLWQDTPTKARTKREARRIGEELEQRAWRQRMGLEPVRAADGGGTVRELHDLVDEDVLGREPVAREERGDDPVPPPHE